MIFILVIVLIAVCTYITFTIFQGKQYPMEHVIYPFPIVLTKEIVRDMKIERADDEFLIFELEFILRKIFILFGGIPAFALACAIYADIDKPYSNIYFPPTPGLIILMFVMFLYGVLSPPRRFVLDRMNGTIAFSRYLFFLRCTIPFSKVVPGYCAGCWDSNIQTDIVFTFNPSIYDRR